MWLYLLSPQVAAPQDVGREGIAYHQDGHRQQRHCDQVGCVLSDRAAPHACTDKGFCEASTGYWEVLLCLYHVLPVNATTTSESTVADGRCRPLTSFSDAVNPTRAADTLPMVTAMLSHASSVLSFAA